MKPLLAFVSIVCLLGPLVGLLAGCSSEEAKHKAAGNVLFKHGDLDGAAREYRAALSANPNDANAHTLLGNLLFEKEQYPEAASEYQAALAIDPNARAALQGAATVALRQRRPADARAAYERMLANQPHDAEAHVALGKLAFADGDLDGAERHLRDALVTAQNDASALYTLGLVLAKKRDQAQANAIFDRLERVTPGKAYAPYGRAVAAAVQGQTDEALKQLALALDRGVEDLGQVERDESFAELRSTPQFRALLERAHARAPAQKKGTAPP
jgi:tetratricopeptide (TPR) repeat protein